MNFLKINNRKNFVLKEVPLLHPESKAYLSFWREQMKRIIEGFWTIDDSTYTIQDLTSFNPTITNYNGDKWRFIPPALYFYGNFFTILHSEENAPKTAPKIKKRPDVRDVELEIFYDVFEARGFSGFELDEDYTCCRDLIDPFLEGNPQLYDKSCFNSKGKLKTYIPAFIYLRQLHTKYLGKPLYRNGAKNYILLSSREIGKSFIQAGLINHELITDGRKEYRPGEELPIAEIFVGSGMASKSLDLMKKAERGMSELPGAWKKGTKEEIPSPLFKQMAGSIKANNKWEHKYSKKTGGNWKSINGSSVTHIPFTIENPEAAAGGRYTYIFIDEVGLTSNLLTIHSSNEAAMQKGVSAMGSSIYMGTGGNMEKILDAETMFRDPEAYNCLSFDDEWENTGKIGRFVPAYYKDNEFKDENGNTDVDRAIKYYEHRRKQKEKAKNNIAINGEMMNYPLKPSEMFLRDGNSNFPVADLQKTLATLLTDRLLLDSSWKVEMRINENGIIEPELSKKTIIRDYPYRNKKGTDCCIEIFEMPKKNADDIIPYNRYLSGCLLPGEKVLTNEGLVNVELVDKEYKLINQKGNLVDIIDCLKYDKIDEDVYTIKMANTYRTTTFTKEHPILISDPKKGYVSLNKCKRLGVKQRYYKFDFNFTEVKNVKEKQWVKYPNIYKKEIDITNYWSNEGIRIDRKIINPLNNKDFWWLVGLWLGDGWCENNKYKVSICFNKKEKFYINKAKYLLNTIFNREVYERERDSTVELSISNLQLSKFLTDTFGSYAYGKELPEWVKYINNEFKKQLILGYLASDGCVYIDRKNTYSTEFVSISLCLLEGIQDILFSLGIVSSITKLRNKGIHSILNRKFNTKETYHLRIAHNETIKLKSQINNEDLKLDKIDLNNIKSKTPVIGCFMSEDLEYIYFRIESITKSMYTGKVYNFHCDTNTYLCPHITTHNCDPVDDDDVYKDSSLLSSFILDTWTDRIVAEYTAKPELVNDYYEQLRRLLIFYNAKVLYEKNKKGLYQYFDTKKCTYLLEETPKFLLDIMDIRISSIGNQAFGVAMSTSMNNYSVKLIKAWLMAQAYDKPQEVMNLHQLRSPALLQELIKYSEDINCDRISAFKMLMLFRESKVKHIEKARQNNSKRKERVSDNKLWDFPFRNKTNFKLC